MPTIAGDNKLLGIANNTLPVMRAFNFMLKTLQIYYSH